MTVIEPIVIETAFAIVLAFSLVHLFAYKIYGYSDSYKGVVLSFSGGIGAAFVFFDLLPILVESRTHFQAVFGGNPLVVPFLEEMVFATAFLGFIVFFMLDYAAVYSRRKRAVEEREDITKVTASKPVFVVHLANLMMLSFLVSYVVRFEVRVDVLFVVLYSIAISLHFFVADEAMEDHYGEFFVSYGRYALAPIPLIAWFTSVFLPERRSEAYVLLAFIAGAVLFNVIRDEVPKAGGREPAAFIAGAFIYAIISVAIAFV